MRPWYPLRPRQDHHKWPPPSPDRTVPRSFESGSAASFGSFPAPSPARKSLSTRSAWPAAGSGSPCRCWLARRRADGILDLDIDRLRRDLRRIRARGTADTDTILRRTQAVRERQGATLLRRLASIGDRYDPEALHALRRRVRLAALCGRRGRPRARRGVGNQRHLEGASGRDRGPPRRSRPRGLAREAGAPSRWPRRAKHGRGRAGPFRDRGPAAPQEAAGGEARRDGRASAGNRDSAQEATDEGRNGTLLILIRHPSPVPLGTPGLPDDDRRLTPHAERPSRSKATLSSSPGPRSRAGATSRVPKPLSVTRARASFPSRTRSESVRPSGPPA